MYVLFSNKIYSFATNTPLNNGQKGNFRQSRENMYISTKLLLRTVQSLKIVDNIVEIEKKNPLVIIMFQSVTHQKQKSKTFISVSILKIFGSVVYISISLPSPFKCCIAGDIFFHTKSRNSFVRYLGYTLRGYSYLPNNKYLKILALCQFFTPNGVETERFCSNIE